MPALLAPALFVLMWSTGWVVAKLATPHAGPLTFLTLRYAAALMLLAPVALLSGARWPRDPAQWGGALVRRTVARWSRWCRVPGRDGGGPAWHGARFSAPGRRHISPGRGPSRRSWRR